MTPRAPLCPDQSVYRFPAPWRVEGYETALRQMIYRVVANNHEPVVVCDTDKEKADAIVRSRNAGTAEDDLRSAQERWQRSLDHAHDETAAVRKAWHDETGLILRNLYAARNRNSALEALCRAHGIDPDRAEAESPNAVKEPQGGLFA